MRIILFGKEGCGKCSSAEDKLKRFALDYEKRDFEQLQRDPTGTTGVDRDELIEAGVVWAAEGGDFPVFVIDGIGMTYPEAMKFLKKRRA